PFRLQRLVRTVVIARHDCFGVTNDLPHLTTRQFLSVLVDYAYVVTRNRLADRMKLVRMLVRQKRATPAAFGHPEIFGQSSRPTVKDFALELCRKWRGGAVLHHVGRQIEAIEFWMSEQPLILHRDEHRMRDTVALGELEKFADIELIHQHERAAAR